MGLAAAMTEHLACKLVTMPALEMEMLCCSIAYKHVAFFDGHQLLKMLMLCRTHTRIMSLDARHSMQGCKGNLAAGVNHSVEYHLVNADSVLVIHLVKLIDQADPLVGQDQGATLQSPFPCDGVLLY